ncbi:MAG TPA: LacI family DNA-binding transcriptional regulator [Rhizomicrobium sp.]|nr:LacI family DNA-binding transcriptional regulator [Rhizomicrobium sp.]
MIKKNSRRGGKSATIQEVAHHAGVSPMTVSRVVNGESVVREDTRKKVLASIKALRYSPNPAARSLAGAKSFRIGLLYSNPSAAYLSEFLVGSLEQSSESGAQLMLEKCDGPTSERTAIKRLAEAGADGIILPPPLCDSVEALQAVLAAGIPGVIVATGHPASEFSAISIDDFAAAREMTRKLIALGHTRIGFITGHPNQTASARRHEGFLAGMEEAGLAVAPTQLAQGYFTYRSGMEAAEMLLKANPRPTAIFASNDDMAAATIAVAHRLGLDVPRDLSVAGFDDVPLATAIWPALTTIHQPVAKMAREAVKLLLDQIRKSRTGEKAPIVHRLLDFTLISRDSTMALKKA